ncbi:MAG: HAD-IIIA family hydrolase, partial [Anaerolineae bacterium]
MTRTKTLWVREPYLGQILAGRKTVEVRVAYDNIRPLEPGDRLKLNDRHIATIRRVTHYVDFEELLAQEDARAIAPDLDPGALLQALRGIYPPHKEALGAVALEIAPRRYDAVLFDMGYTLVYFEPPQEEVVQEALRAIGATRSTEQIMTAVERVWGDYYRHAETERFPATEAHDRETQNQLSAGLLAALEVEASAEALETYHHVLDGAFARPGAIRPYPETEKVLAALRQQAYRLAIVSNWSWNLRQRVAQAGLEGYFQFVWASAYAGCNKPHPCIFQRVLEEMDLDPGRTLYVGDSYRHDVQGARNAGIDPVLVDRQGDDQERDCP